jgi:hypothetical protein
VIGSYQRARQQKSLESVTKPPIACWMRFAQKVWSSGDWRQERLCPAEAAAVT